MTIHQDTASALLRGTTLSRILIGQGSTSLFFSRWRHERFDTHPLPFEVELEFQGEIQFYGSDYWEQLRVTHLGSDEEAKISFLVRVCRSGDDATVEEITTDGPHLRMLFVSGVTVAIHAQVGQMGPDWIIKEHPPSLPAVIVWSVYSEGGVVDSKRP